MSSLPFKNVVPEELTVLLFWDMYVNTGCKILFSLVDWCLAKVGDINFGPQVFIFGADVMFLRQDKDYNLKKKYGGN